MPSKRAPHTMAAAPSLEMREILETAIRPVNRVRLGSALSALSREAGLTNADVEPLEQGGDRKPAEPMNFE